VVLRDHFEHERRERLPWTNATSSGGHRTGWEGVTRMWSIRICIIAAVVMGLNACTREADNPPPAAVSSPDPAPSPPPATSVETANSPTVKPPVTQPATPPAKTKANTPVAPVAPVAKTPVPNPTTTKAAPTPDAPVTLDLTGLEQQLKSTKAIGVFSKIALKNQVDDLMKQFREHYKGKSSPTMEELRQSYDLLIMKVLSLVQKDDKNLAAAIVSSRTEIWNLLTDPKKFAALDV
jgi:hypothetical protein